jgi:chromosome segregation ATPase
MAHSVSEAAARAVKNSERKKVEETRTPEQIIKTMRSNLAAHLAITPSDLAVLLGQHDARQNEAEQLKFMVEQAAEALVTTRADRDKFATELVEVRAANEQAGRVVMEQTLKIQELTNEVAAIKGIVG